MPWKIDRGLFKYDLIDHYAILCVAVDASSDEIRKRYISIARFLHPDSNRYETDTDKQKANEFLSKLVNPAYEKLSGERSRAEYIVVLSQIGKRLLEHSVSLEVSSDLAKQLVAAPNIDLLYKNAIAKIAHTQFNDLQKVPQIISQISELNLVYLMRTAASSIVVTPDLNPEVNPTRSPLPPKEESVVEPYLRRAQSLIEKNQFTPAKVELQDALKLEPRNSRCHSLIAMVYLRQNQLTMAKVHFENALRLDPNDKLALEWKPKVDKLLGKASGASGVNSSPNSGDTLPDKSGGGGLFGGLFGGKKK